MLHSPPIWLFHGWAANHHVFDPLYEAMPPSVQAAWHAPDLPGHGTAPPPDGAFDLDAAADAYAAQISEPAHLVGWSFGGMVALNIAARHPDSVASLCLTASLAKLTAAEDYPQGLQRTALASMVPHFETDYKKSIGQFLELQVMYADDGTRRRVRELLPVVAGGGTPTGLRAALNALEQADLRPVLHRIHCPVLLIYGNRDTLTPVRMGSYLHEHLPHSRLCVIDRAAHAPFLSHTAQFARELTDFWKHTAP